MQSIWQQHDQLNAYNFTQGGGRAWEKREIRFNIATRRADKE